MVSSENTSNRPYHFYLEAKNEAKILRDLYHPTIISLFEVVDEPKKVYLFLELCFGGNLFEII